MQIAVQRHPKEHIYRTICLAIGGAIWAAIVLPTKGMILIPLVFIGLSLWIAEKFFQASFFGNSVMITEKQYPALHAMVTEESKKLLGQKKPPLAFVYNADGAMNAFAIKYLSKKYIILFDQLIDVLWDNKKNDALRTIVAHEIAHHAAGHTNFWINLVLFPAFFVPYLGPAYSRSRELTADRTAAESVKNPKAAMSALVALASGSKALQSQTNIDAFIEQEAKVPALFGFLLEIVATHPRLTKRVIALSKREARQTKTAKPAASTKAAKAKPKSAPRSAKPKAGTAKKAVKKPAAGRKTGK